MVSEECHERINNLTVGVPPYIILRYLTPTTSTVWQPRSTVWTKVFLSYTIIFSLLYLAIGMLAIIISVKRKCHRLKTKTFIAVYTCMAIFGISRSLHFALDPYTIIGWIGDPFKEWIIFSRILMVLGFPSFSSAYILVFITLYKSVDSMSSWHQSSKFIGLVLVAHYSVAITGELLTNSGPYPAVLSISICNAMFCLWGITICIIYIFSGCRLLLKIKKQQTKAMRLSTSFADDKARRIRAKNRAMSRDDILYNENVRRKSEKTAKTVRKIALITFFSAMMGIIYSLLNLVSLLFMVVFTFVHCIGLNGRSDPTVWLSLQITLSIIEIPLALIMLYSVTDVSSIFECCRRKSVKAMSAKSNQQVLVHSFDSLSPAPSTHSNYPPMPTVPPPSLPVYKIMDPDHLSTDGSLSV